MQIRVNKGEVTVTPNKSENTYLHKEQARLYERWNSSGQPFIGDGI
jgi:hypothetical protein